MKLSAQLVAALQAAALWALHQAYLTDSWPASMPAAMIACYLVVVGVPLTLLLLWSHRQQRTLWIAAAGLAAFLAWTGYQTFAGVPGPLRSAAYADGSVAGFMLPLILGWLLFLPLLRGRLESGVWRAPYAVLFRGSWRSYLALAESLLFTGVFWALLLLWAVLFGTLQIDFFMNLFTDSRFVYPATTLAFATATQIIGSSDRLIDGVLDQLLDLLKWLLPLAGLIVIAFTIALLPRLPALFASGERVIGSAVMLALVAMTVLLINAAYRDGDSPSGYAPLLQQALRVVPLLLAVVAAIACYSIVLRTQALGLTPARYWGVVTAAFAVFYAVGYAYAALRSQPWLGAIRHVNFALAVLLLATLATSLTPLGDPRAWSVRSQTARALAAQDDKSREGALRFLRDEGGVQGQRALESLAAAGIVARESSRSEPETDPAATPARYAKWRQGLRTVPQGRAVPAALESALRSEFMRAASALDPGGKAPLPLLIFGDLNADGLDDALLLAGPARGQLRHLERYRLFVADGESWRKAAAGTF